MTPRLTRRFAAVAALAALTLAAPAFAQKSAAQLDWEAKQAEFMAANLKEKGWKATASGLQYKRLSKARPKGAQPKADSIVTVAYEGRTVSDVVFDASPEGEPITFGFDEVIKGWGEAIPMMRVGETWEFVIPAELAYGDRSRPKIPAGSALRFKVELLDVKAPS